MSPGMSPEFQRRQFSFSTPLAAETVPKSPASPPASGGRSIGKTLRAALPAFLLVLFLIALVAVVVSTILSGWPGSLGQRNTEVGQSVTSTPVRATSVPSPTVITVATECPEGCVREANVPVQVVAQPMVVVVPYPIIYEQVVVDQVPHHGYAGYGSDRFESREYGASGCSGLSVYVVRPGDTVYQIARRCRVDPQAIVQANGLWDPNYIWVGQVLSIPCTPAHW